MGDLLTTGGGNSDENSIAQDASSSISNVGTRNGSLKGIELITNWCHWNNYDFLYFFNAWRVVFAINTDKYGICNTRCILHEHCYFGWRTYNGTQFRKSLDYVVVTWFNTSFLVLTTHSAPPHGLADWSRPGFQRIVRRIDIIWAGCAALTQGHQGSSNRRKHVLI